MTPRPYFTRKERPVSAIYIGSLTSNPAASPPDLPKVPEPTQSSSPRSSSGLPSPPATNSTGSGSLGDETANTGSVRQRPSQRPSIPHNMYAGSSARAAPGGNGASTSVSDEDDHNDNENDEDNTARFNASRGLPASRAAPADNKSALQRVRSLTERNRMVLDKLTSISRGSPVPGSSKTLSRSSNSPAIVPSPAFGTTPRSRPPSHSYLRSPFPTPRDERGEPAHSGSETERESSRSSKYSHTYSSSDSLSNTPTSSYAPTEDFARPRQHSAPNSPAKSPRKNRHSSPGPSLTPRKHTPMAIPVSEFYRTEEHDVEDVTKAALAAVASARRSPGSSGKRNPSRGALPQEFRDRGSRSVVDDRSEPPTPLLERYSQPPRSPSPTKGSARPTSAFPTPSQAVDRSPRKLGGSRYSTVRELTRRHQTRWLSEDLSTPAMDLDVPPTPNRSHVFSVTDVGRRATPRSGSSESPYGVYPRLGEGLRTGGAQRRRGTPNSDEANGDVFGSTSRPATSAHSADSPSSAPLRRALSTGTRSAVNGNGNGGDVDSPSPMPPLQRAASRLAEWRASTTTPARTSETRTASARTVSAPYATPSRPSTSMAALNHETPASSSRPVRSYRHSVTGDITSSTAALEDPIQLNGTFAPDRTYTPSCNTTRRSTQGDSQREHQKLLSDALATFESQLQRLPPMGHTTTNTIPEVFQSSQQIVQSLDSLNGLLRESMLHARDEEVNAELADDPAQINLVELWASIGSESRDRLRITEDLVRTMTQFFLGVGKVLRDAASVPGAQNHNRTTSLEDEVARRNTPEGSNSVSSSDKHSAGRLSRRSWEPQTLAETRAVSRLASRERSGTTSRPSSATQSHTHSSTTSSSEGRSRVEGVREQTYTPPTSRVTSSTLLMSGSRRYSPMDSRLAAESPGPTAAAVQTLDSQETLRPHEQGHFPHPIRTRTLPPLSIPPSLPTLPSESLISRTPSLSERSDRRKISTGSTVTLRPESTLPPVIKPPNTTTALTTTIESPLDIGSAISRTSSISSSFTNGVTFSRPSPDSMASLRQQNDREPKSIRARTFASSLIEARSPISGSETERPARRIVVRPRASLDRGVVVDVEDGPPSRASTLTASRRERRRTVTSASEIFAEMR